MQIVFELILLTVNPLTWVLGLALWAAAVTLLEAGERLLSRT
jgi:hypothetical protein